MSVNRQFRLKSRPTGRAGAENFDFVSSPMPHPGNDDVLVRTLYLSMDPTNRIWMSDMAQYLPPVELGAVMRGIGLGRVVATHHPGFAEGDLVSGMLGWQDYSLLSETGNLTRIPAGLPIPLPTLFNVCGVTGLTAYFGMELAKPQAGDTLVVSAASGAVGSVVGQLGKIYGCRVVGITGGAEKCRHVVEDLGFDEAVDYRSPDWVARLEAATPHGIDINFENVGGEIMQAVMRRMSLFSRMTLCGMISGYNENVPALGDFAPILMQRINLRGVIILDFAERFGEGIGKLASWLAEGKIKGNETIVDGLENAPDALNRLFDGDKLGKLMVKVAA